MLRARFKNRVLFVLIACQVLGSTRIDAQGPPPLPPDFSTRTSNYVLDLVSSLSQNPFTDGALGALLLWALWQSGGLAKESLMTKFPLARKNRRELIDKWNGIERDYLRKRDEYLKFPERIEALEAANKGLQAELKQARQEGSFLEADDLKSQIRANRAEIQEMKKKVPVILMEEAILGAKKVEADLDKHVQSLRERVYGFLTHADEWHSQQEMELSGLEKSIEAWRKNRSRDALNGWLRTHGKAVFGSDTQWLKDYRRLSQESKNFQKAILAIDRKLTDALNKTRPEEDPVPRLAPTGRADRYVILPRHQGEKSSKIDREELPLHIGVHCRADLAALSEQRDAAKSATKILKNYRAQAGWGGAFAASAASVGWYVHRFEKRYQQTIAEARARAIKEEKLTETASLDFSGQIDEERKFPGSRIHSFDKLVTEMFETHLEEVLSTIESTLDNPRAQFFGSANKALREHLQQARKDPAGEKRRIWEAYDRSLKKVYKSSGEVLASHVLDDLFTDDSATRDVKNLGNIAAVYRQMLALLFVELPSGTSDLVDRKVLAKMAQKTNERLAQMVEEENRRKAAATKRQELRGTETKAAFSTPGEGTPAPEPNILVNTEIAPATVPVPPPVTPVSLPSVTGY